jgi:hypothetical protein
MVRATVGSSQQASTGDEELDRAIDYCTDRIGVLGPYERNEFRSTMTRLCNARVNATLRDLWGMLDGEIPRQRRARRRSARVTLWATARIELPAGQRLRRLPLGARGGFGQQIAVFPCWGAPQGPNRWSTAFRRHGSAG